MGEQGNLFIVFVRILLLFQDLRDLLVLGLLAIGLLRYQVLLLGMHFILFFPCLRLYYKRIYIWLGLF